MAGVADTDWILHVTTIIPELLLLGGVLPGRQDRVEDVFCVGVGQILGIDLILGKEQHTLFCFLPAVDTSTGFEYLTKLGGCAKFAWDCVAILETSIFKLLSSITYHITN